MYPCSYVHVWVCVWVWGVWDPGVSLSLSLCWLCFDKTSNICCVVVVVCVCVLLNFIIILPVSLVIKGRGKGGRGRDTERDRQREREREREEVSIILDWCFIYHVIVDCCLTAFGTSFSFLFYLVLSSFPPLNSYLHLFSFLSLSPPPLSLSPSLSPFPLFIQTWCNNIYQLSLLPICIYIHSLTHAHFWQLW